MLTNKEIDYKIMTLAYHGEGELIELIRYGDAGMIITRSVKLEPYSSDLSLAIEAAKRIADKWGYTFVLTYDNDEWKAAFGNYGDCSEYKGFNPAYATCMSILQFMGKL